MKRKQRRLAVENLEERRLLAGGNFETWDGGIAASSDDAEEKPSGSMRLASSDLELTQDKTNQQVVGMRFTGVNIPPGASIQNAYIQFQADETGSDVTSLTIYAEAVDNATTFVDATRNITNRTTTFASVAWSPVPWTTVGQAGPDEQTSDIATVIQEIVNRPGWSSGNALAIIITGTGKRTAESFNGVSSAALRLHVEYLPGNLTPTTSGIADVNVNTDAPDTVIDLFAAFDDFEDPDPALTYTIENNTNSTLFTSTSIDGVLGTLTLDYTPATNATADITIRATDTGTPSLFVETTLSVTVSPINQPPTTTGITDVFAAEDADNTAIELFAVFDDPEDLDSALTYTVEANTNSALFTSTNINGALGILTLNYAPDANGSADITVRATDTGIPVLFVETTFTVEISEVNNTPILSSGSVDNLTVVQNSPATPLGLADLGYGPGGSADENGQTLSYSVTSVPSSSLGEVVLSDGTTVVTPGAYTLAQIQGMQFLATANVFGGPETFSYTVTDNGTTDGVADFKTLNQSLLIDVIENIPDPIIVDVRVAASSDDAEEKPSGSMRLASSDLELTQDKTNQQVVGMRFTGVNIPPGASIQNAYIQFQADETGSDVTSLTIYAEAVDNATTFVDATRNITNRTTTFASVAWSPVPWTTVGQAGPDEQTSDIATVIQEIVNRPGWSSGNALAIIITGTGKRTAESFNGVSARRPRLHVEYLPGNLTPTTSGIADVNVNTDAPDTVIDLFAAFDDFEDPDPALTYTIENNTNSTLFTSTSIDGVLGTLTLDYTPATNATADITIRATDTGTPSLFVETTLSVTVSPINQPPTTTGITDVFAAEDADNTAIELFAVFDDPEDLDSALTYTVEANTNSALFTSTNINGALGILTLNYAPDANGSADITVRATDTGIPVLFVETTFTVEISEVNNTPILSSGSVDNLTVVQNSPATPLGLADLGYGPGGSADENGQTLSYSVTSVPSSSLGEVVLSDGTTVVTPGAYTLAQIQGMQFLATANVFGGPETFSYTVTDNGTTDGVADFKTLNQSLLIDVIENIPDPIIVDVRVAARSDDAEERFSGVVKFVSKDLDMVDDPTESGVQQTIGIRFNGLAIPPGAVITNAYVQFQASAFDDDATSLQFHGEATDNAATFDTSDFNVTSRQVTNASVSWAPPIWTSAGDAGVDQQTPSIASVIQEIVDRGGWVAGNSMVLIITGIGERAAVSYDGDVVNGTTGAPLLHVEFTTPSLVVQQSAGNQPPGAQSLDEGQLALIDEAILRLSHSVSPAAPSKLAHINIEVVDLPGNMLGRALTNVIQIDTDAAGFGWFVDATPHDDVEFMQDAATRQFVAPAGSPASDRIDLLTVVLHELGHVLGLEHTSSHGPMDAELPLGTRR